MEEYLLGGKSPRTEPSDGKYEKHLRAEPQDWTGGGSISTPNWGVMDKEKRIPEYIRDNKHRSACKNAYKMHNC